MSARIVPPFTAESALAKVRAAERAWNSRDPEIVAQAYSEDSEWRNRTEFFGARRNQSLPQSVRFEYEWHEANGHWYRTQGNEHWEFDEDGLMRRRDMSANDYPIEESERRYHW